MHKDRLGTVQYYSKTRPGVSVSQWANSHSKGDEVIQCTQTDWEQFNITARQGQEYQYHNGRTVIARETRLYSAHRQTGNSSILQQDKARSYTVHTDRLGTVQYYSKTRPGVSVTQWVNSHSKGDEVIQTRPGVSVTLWANSHSKGDEVIQFTQTDWEQFNITAGQGQDHSKGDEVIQFTQTDWEQFNITAGQGQDHSKGNEVIQFTQTDWEQFNITARQGQDHSKGDEVIQFTQTDWEQFNITAGQGQEYHHSKGNEVIQFTQTDWEQFNITSRQVQDHSKGDEVIQFTQTDWEQFNITARQGQDHSKGDEVIQFTQTDWEQFNITARQGQDHIKGDEVIQFTQTDWEQFNITARQGQDHSKGDEVIQFTQTDWEQFNITARQGQEYQYHNGRTVIAREMRLYSAHRQSGNSSILQQDKARSYTVHTGRLGIVQYYSKTRLGVSVSQWANSHSKGDEVIQFTQTDWEQFNITARQGQEYQYHNGRTVGSHFATNGSWGTEMRKTWAPDPFMSFSSL
ncbi:hypothetical protein J6590_081737 [Homalodisca vitripennis]|nr:hypothetical protein J6590_081737 [Homalodisca vitripennis]